jgi:hypothetical protein
MPASTVMPGPQGNGPRNPGRALHAGPRTVRRPFPILTDDPPRSTCPGQPIPAGLTEIASIGVRRLPFLTVDRDQGCPSATRIGFRPGNLVRRNDDRNRTRRLAAGSTPADLRP